MVPKVIASSCPAPPGGGGGATAQTHTPSHGPMPLPRGMQLLARQTRMLLINKITFGRKLVTGGREQGLPDTALGGARARAGGGMHPPSAQGVGKAPWAAEAVGLTVTPALWKNTACQKKVMALPRHPADARVSGPWGRGESWVWSGGGLHQGFLEPPRTYGATNHHVHRVSAGRPLSRRLPELTRDRVPALDTGGGRGAILGCIGGPLSPCSRCTHCFLSTCILGRGLGRLLIA